MWVMEQERTRPAKIQLVDNWSDQWKETLAMLDEIGQREVLRLDDEGWLPARQNLLVAFQGARAVGYLCFHVSPVIENGTVLKQSGRTITEAVVDGEGSLPDAARTITRQLREASMHRALELRCARFRWEAAPAEV